MRIHVAFAMLMISFVVAAREAAPAPKLLEPDNLPIPMKQDALQRQQATLADHVVSTLEAA